PKRRPHRFRACAGYVVRTTVGPLGQRWSAVRRCEMTDVPLQATAAAATPARSTTRLLFIDNIRWSMIILVLSMHAFDTYSPFGNWYYVDRPKSGFGTEIFFAVYQSVLQAFFMAVLFFVAGYFSADAYDRKGLSTFIRDRLLRLGLPTLLYMLVIGPL